MKTDLVSLHADHVESLIDSGGVFSLRIEPGDTQRQAVIDHGGAVLDELRHRGYYDIRATVERYEDGEDDGMGGTLRAGEYFAIGFAKDEGDDQSGV